MRTCDRFIFVAERQRALLDAVGMRRALFQLGLHVFGEVGLLAFELCGRHARRANTGVLELLHFQAGDALEANPRDSCVVEVYSRERRTRKIGTLDIGVSEVCAREVCIDEMRDKMPSLVSIPRASAPCGPRVAFGRFV